MCGDFPSFDQHNVFAVTMDSAHNHELSDIAFTFDLSQIVDEFTRLQGESASILNLVFLSGGVGNN